jgi:hypothetical protein
VYKVFFLETQEEIVILEPRWRERISELRILDHKNLLVCPGCQQPVRVRAGKYRRWHFAHKHLENCLFARQSPELLEVRALLYDWLIERFGIEKVIIEKNLPGLPRPMDAWVQSGESGYGYWIFDTRLSPELRSMLKQVLEGQNLKVNWLFTVNLLNEDEFYPGRLHLTTTEREFLRPSTIDTVAEAAGEASGLTIHYLDSEKLHLITFRRLQLHHPPQRFAGRKLESSLKEIRALTGTGEFIHPVEVDRISRYQKEASAAQQRFTRQEQFLRSISEKRSLATSSPGEEKPVKPDSTSSDSQKTMTTLPQIENSISEPDQSRDRLPFTREGVCRICGKHTTDWISYFGKTGECICRDCAGKR